MTLLTKYLLNKFLKIFILIEFVMIFIFLSVDYLNNLDRFIEAGLKTSDGIFFVIFKIPFVIVHLTPVSIVISLVVMFGLMHKNKEITALCSSGISLVKIYTPVIVLSLALSLMVFFISDFLMPSASAKLNYINLVKIRKRKILTRKRNNIWLKEHDKIIYIDYFDSNKNLLRKITINGIDKKNNIIKRTIADSASYKNGKWILKDVYLSENLDKDYGQKIDFMDTLPERFSFSPVELKESVKTTEEMSFIELARHVAQLGEKGYNIEKPLVDLYAKIAFPFANFIMALIGTLIGLNSATGQKIPFGVGISLFSSFLYWSFYSFTLSLGYGEIINPFIAAWSANIIFGMVSLFLYVFFENKLLQS
ncbi:MAG: hypothetical protein CSA18_02415 [Deltaproteobacteria bacterium]|nr:MAG: hypothetical protein CSB21_01050 [Deltaproteobacteria bacterium]PIE74981.1 MAG: hypothetical protein CSA18_02415 [Deltaproteobacteria bacterium]